MPDAEERPALAASLDRLFEDVRPHGPRGRRYTNEEVATAVKQDSPGVRVGGAYLSALRKGTKRNPSTELLAALARFFGVPVAYFLDEQSAAAAGAEIELASVAHNLGVRRLALRALELSPEGLAAVTRIVEDVLDGHDDQHARGGGAGRTDRAGGSEQPARGRRHGGPPQADSAPPDV
ncbi:helix-turn-helix domain-containing protein [Streptomyces oceani]|uniref:helix-turn-helix domain-containing protein n=1 Tax=Streptomyces oceani TaxID=1075402 RepID=UPI0008733B41|nr:helix-turn-helix transcriptional regulator [Streptomyces oceani]